MHCFAISPAHICRAPTSPELAPDCRGRPTHSAVAFICSLRCSVIRECYAVHKLTREVGTHGGGALTGRRGCSIWSARCRSLQPWESHTRSAYSSSPSWIPILETEVRTSTRTGLKRYCWPTRSSRKVVVALQRTQEAASRTQDGSRPRTHHLGRRDSYACIQFDMCPGCSTFACSKCLHL